PQRNQFQHQHNKLHKPNDPRGHQQVDSGVGLTEHQPIQSSKHEQTDIPEDTAGDYYTHRPAEQPPSVVDSEPTRHALPQDSRQETVTRESGSDERPRSHFSEKAQSNMSGKETMNSQDSSDSTPPYWGNLPKGQKGGIYNTVMGHGSPKDDHAQHHHLPQRSANSERSHITGPVVTDHPRGGVYNSVAGHGSNDDESKRHSTSPTSAGGARAPTISSTTAVLNAPLVSNPHDKNAQSQYPSAETKKPDVGNGFLPKTAARDDARLAHTMAAEQKLSNTPTHPQPDTAHQRAFPLGPSNMVSDEDTTKPHSHDQDHRNALLAGAGGLGTGIAASTLADRHEPKKEEQRTPVATEDDSRRRKRLSKDYNGNKAPAGGLPDTHHNGKDKHPVEKKKSHEEEHSPKGEKKHHKILGIFHRHKDDKAQEDTSTYEPAKEHSPRHHKEEAVVAPKKHRDSHEHKERVAEPTKQHDEDRSKDKMHKAEGAAAGAGALGFMHHHNKGDKETNQHQDKHDNVPQKTQPDTSSRIGPSSTVGGVPAFENPREPPRAPADHQSGHTMLAGSTGSGSPKHQTGHSNQTTDRGNYNTLASGIPSGVASGTSHQQPAQSSTTERGNHDALASGTAAGVASGVAAHNFNHRDAHDAHRSSESGGYNNLASGTTSGVAAHSGPSHSSSSGPANTARSGESSSPAYNVLSSGTPSGVKVEPKQPRSSIDTTSNSSHGRRSGDYNTLSSGTTSGYPKHHDHGPQQAPVSKPERRREDDVAERLKHMSPEVMPSAYTSSAPRPERRGDERHMSPEFMPSAYTASAPRPEHRGDEKHMSPEVMPSSYTSSAPRGAVPPTATDDSKRYTQPQQQEHHSSSVNPALAAATGAWAATAGPSSGNNNGFGQQQQQQQQQQQ
ncbi:hypothetical protein B0H66DRAFT_445805, partial [Apodospora peruviana]